MTERVLDWKHLRGPDFARLDRDRTVVTVCVSPLEVHGPHLPTITDCLEGEALLGAAMERLRARFPELVELRLPTLFAATDVLPHAGSLMFRASTVERLVEDLGRSLAAQGFRHVWVTNFHAGPRHVAALEVACDRVNRRHGARMVSVFSLLAARLAAAKMDVPDLFAGVPGARRESLEGDSHGGYVETSLLLHLLGAHVDPAFAALPVERRDGANLHGKRPGPLELLAALRQKLLYYQDHTYRGAPADASAELGARFLDELAARTADALAEIWEGRAPLESARSPLWRARWLLGSEALRVVIERLIGAAPRVF